MKTRNASDPAATAEDAAPVTAQAAPALAQAPAPAKAAYSKMEDGRFTVGSPVVQPLATVPKKPYWVGTLEGGPVHGWTCPGAGVRFTRATGQLDEKGRYAGQPGQVVYLTDEQLALTLQNVRDHVVRWLSDKEGARTGRVWPVKYAAYRASPGDEPLGRYLYLYELDPQNPQNRPTLRPEPLVK